ncbi:hypothetical protein RvY_18884-2 [Ramazzottius varieornatus]|uniref:Alpha-1,3-mannosyl-glycoprotein 2-beta-N-acetylglucosaminyltransferase n=1 Tax=Ramazzottius varieornatus TaxID=947166 RepID=A0A1D1W7E1_RAMVA|nr:hypothetical protein RvY_18884-2 [Ramazzottius varieornatus]
MKRKVGYFVGSGITLIWIIFFYQYMLFQQRSHLDFEGDSEEAPPQIHRLAESGIGASPKVSRQLAALRKEVETLTSQNDQLQHYVHRVQNVIGEGRLNSTLTILPSPVPVIAVVVFGCNRPTIRRHLDQLIKYRPSAASFPIYVSQDCGHEETARVISSYGDQVTHMKHTNNTPIILPKKDKKFEGYYKIARHYKWGLSQIFDKYNHSAVIITEDDLDISPDFFEYFAGTYPLLVVDKSLWCISAWNDNGKAGLIANAPELLYRTDFFPGLGWMLRRELWAELGPKWPDKFVSCSWPG